MRGVVVGEVMGAVVGGEEEVIVECCRGEAKRWRWLGNGVKVTYPEGQITISPERNYST